MRLHVLSDLHLEFAGFRPPRTDADVVILAGDTHVGCEGVAWAAGAFGDHPVVYVPGNHEFYGHALPKHVHDMRRAARGTNVHVLDRGVLDLDGVRILGCTLWTDFALDGHPRLARSLADEMLWDYREISVLPTGRDLQPADTARRHHQARRWLETEMAAASGPTVVVTHHAPSRQSVSPEADDQPYAPAYASDLDDLIATGGPSLWIHGHTHLPRDYRLGATRVVSNPRGYPGQSRKAFDPGLVLEV